MKTKAPERNRTAISSLEGLGINLYTTGASLTHGRGAQCSCQYCVLTCYRLVVGQRGELFSSRTTVGNRTYFFNVKENRVGDVYLNVVESKKRGNETDFERHSIMVFEEDMGGFLASFDKAIRFIRAREQTRRG